MQWNDEQLNGEGYVEWYPFAHPQLGKVELGGWHRLYTWWNPPPALLEQEVARFPQWLVWHLLISPLLELYSADVLLLGNDLYRVRMVVQNTGWLPSYVTQIALEKQRVRGCLCKISLPEGATLVSGKEQEDVGQLEGRAYKSLLPHADPTDERAKAEWIVRAAAGSVVHLMACHDRAGVIRAELKLG